MSDTQSDSSKLKSQAEKMNLALESVNTESQAIELINGKILDAFILKFKIDLENRSGVNLVLVSKQKKEILVLYSVFSGSPFLRKVRTFEDSLQLCHDLLEVKKSGPIDAALSESVGRTIYQVLTKQLITDLTPQWERNDASGMVNLLESTLKSSLRISRVKVQADAEQISSLKFRYNSILHGEIDPINPPVDTPSPQGASDSNEPQSALERQIEVLTKPYKTVVSCKTVLSPVHGMEFDDLMDGQEVLFRLPFETAEDKARASAMGAVNKEGEPIPIKGKFVGIASGKNEYHIFAEGPSQVLLRSMEERPVKVATPQSVAIANQRKQQQKSAAAKAATPKGDPKMMNALVGIGLVVLSLLIGAVLFLF